MYVDGSWKTRLPPIMSENNADTATIVLSLLVPQRPVHKSVPIINFTITHSPDVNSNYFPLFSVMVLPLQRHGAVLHIILQHSTLRTNPRKPVSLYSLFYRSKFTSCCPSVEIFNAVYSYPIGTGPAQGSLYRLAPHLGGVFNIV